MTDKPREATIARLDNIETRLSDILSKLEENGLKLSYINGDVGHSKEDIKALKKRLRLVEDNEILQEGIEKGKGFMKTSTRNMLIIIIMTLGCLFAGIKTFQSSQEKIVKVVNSILEERK